LDPAHLPGTLDNYTLRFVVGGRETGDTVTPKTGSAPPPPPR
jgi:hypothetical protein